MIVTLSRQIGAGARTIGRMVADRTKSHLVDDEIVRLVAERLRAPQEDIAWHDEHAASAADNMFQALGSVILMSAPLPMDTPIQEWNDDDVATLTQAVIRDLTAANNVVVIGRGARWVVGNRPDALHVHLVAPFNIRVERIALKANGPLDAAEREVRQTDQQRSSYIRHYYHADWDDPRNYHLVLNTCWLSPEIAANLIIQAAHDLIAEGQAATHTS